MTQINLENFIFSESQADDFVGMHRGQMFDKAYKPNTRCCIDDVPVFIVRIKFTNEWFIVSRLITYDDIFSDIGPFDTLEDCVMHFKLMVSI